MKRIIISSLIATSVILSGCTDKLVNYDTNNLGFIASDIQSVIKKTIELSNCSENINFEDIDNIDYTYAIDTCNHIYIKPDSYKVNMKICKDDKEQAKLILEEVTVLNGKPMKNTINPVLRIEKCNSTLKPYLLNITETHHEKVDGTFFKFKNGIESQINLCENENGLNNLEIKIHSSNFIK